MVRGKDSDADTGGEAQGLGWWSLLLVALRLPLGPTFCTISHWEEHTRPWGATHTQGKTQEAWLCTLINKPAG